jgi:hypothetical protein
MSSTNAAELFASVETISEPSTNGTVAPVINPVVNEAEPRIMWLTGIAKPTQEAMARMVTKQGEQFVTVNVSLREEAFVDGNWVFKTLYAQLPSAQVSFEKQVIETRSNGPQEVIVVSTSLDEICRTASYQVLVGLSYREWTPGKFNFFVRSLEFITDANGEPVQRPKMIRGTKFAGF